MVTALCALFQARSKGHPRAMIFSCLLFTMRRFVCSRCGAAADYKEYSGTDPVLLCGCDQLERQWVPEGDGGGHWEPPIPAYPVEVPYSEAEEWDDWIRRR